MRTYPVHADANYRGAGWAAALVRDGQAMGLVYANRQEPPVGLRNGALETWIATDLERALSEACGPLHPVPAGSEMVVGMASSWEFCILDAAEFAAAIHREAQNG